jgi:TonB family protein
LDRRRESSAGLWIGLGASFIWHVLLAIAFVLIGPEIREDKPPVELTVIDTVVPKPARPASPPPMNIPPATIPKVPEVRKPPTKPRPPEPAPPRKPQEPPAPPPTSAPKAEGGGPRRFGIRLENTTLAAPGTGVPVSAGDTVATPPEAKGAGTGTGTGSGSGSGEGEGPPTTALARVQEMPRLKHNSIAEYPADVRRLGIEGRVVLELLIDEDGKVALARVVRPLHPRLDETALVAAKGLVFSPATLDGKPRSVKIPYSYVFVLD